jgi:hypothetical protein
METNPKKTILPRWLVNSVMALYLAPILAVIIVAIPWFFVLAGLVLAVGVGLGKVDWRRLTSPQNRQQFSLVMFLTGICVVGICYFLLELQKSTIVTPLKLADLEAGQDKLPAGRVRLVGPLEIRGDLGLPIYSIKRPEEVSEWKCPVISDKHPSFGKPGPLSNEFKGRIFYVRINRWDTSHTHEDPGHAQRQVLREAVFNAVEWPEKDLSLWVGTEGDDHSIPKTSNETLYFGCGLIALGLAMSVGTRLRSSPGASQQELAPDDPLSN